MNQQKYRELLDSLIEELYKQGDKEILHFYELQKQNRDELLNKIANVMLNYNISNDVLALTPGEIKKQYTQMGNLIKEGISNEVKQEQNSINQLLLNVAKDRYYISSFAISLGLDFKLKKVNSKVLEDIINKKIDGLLYSDRIWNNKNEISKLLRKDIKDFLEGKISVNEISKIIKQRFNSNAYNTKRLVVNEVARVQEATNTYWMNENENDIEWVLRSETLDMKTCKHCADEDGKIYPLKDRPYEKGHVMCRGTWIAIPNKDWRPKKRMNNITKERVPYESYNEWKNKNDL